MTTLVTFCACNLDSSQRLAHLKALVKSWEAQLAPMCPLYLAISGVEGSEGVKGAGGFLDELDQTLGVYVLRCEPCSQFEAYKQLLATYGLSDAWINFVDPDDELLPARNVIQLDLFAQADPAKLQEITMAQHQRFVEAPPRWRLTRRRSSWAYLCTRCQRACYGDSPRHRSGEDSAASFLQRILRILRVQAR